MKKIHIYFLIILFLFSKTLIASPFEENISSLSDAFFNVTGKNEGVTSFPSFIMPAGGREESLGGSFTGLADDISFFEYNPAASSLLSETQLALFHNTLIADSAMETISSASRIGNFGYGGKLRFFYVPFSEYNAIGERISSSYYTETTALFNFSYNFLSGYDFKGLALGANIKAAWRGIPNYSDDNGAIISGSGLSQSALAVAADVGVMLRFNVAKFFYSREPNFKLGFNFLNAGASITGFGQKTILDDPLPTSIAVGVSYQPIKQLVLSTEFRQPINLFKISEYQMWSFGIGAEVKITSFFNFQTGFLIKGANPRISVGGDFKLFKKVQVNATYTFDLTSSASPVNRISVSAKILLGDGGRASTQEKIEILYNEGLSFFAQSDFAKAIEKWQEVLKLDKHFDPAKDGIKSAEKQLKLFDRLYNSQFIEK